MSAETLSHTENTRRNPRVAGGALMIVLGLGLLSSYLFHFSLPVLALAGLSMLGIGIYTRSAGWMIPAGILNGLALGMALTGLPAGVFPMTLTNGAIFALSFALGWFSIPATSMLFTREKNLWALIPGSFIALGGLSMLTDVFNVLQYGSYVLPAFLIVLGLVVIFKKQRAA